MVDMEQKHENNKKSVVTNHVYQHNVYLKEMKFEDGATYCGHHHDYDHITLVASGKVRVKFGAVPQAGIPEETREYTAVSTFVTRSFREHEITSLEPNTVVCCVHALRDVNGEVIIPEMDEEHHHDPDHKLQSQKDFDAALGDAKLGRKAFTATDVELDQMIKRADKEGTLVENSGDQLI